MESQTIVSQATPMGRSSIAVIRISGSDSFDIVKKITKTEKARAHHEVALLQITNSRGEKLDKGLFTFFVSPNSYTGENIVEISCHGNPLIVKVIIDRCVQLGARIADPGEYTKRAFLNNKISLSQAESVGILISSRSEEALIQNNKNIEGKSSKRVSNIKSNLVKALSNIEHELDVTLSPKGNIISINGNSKNIIITKNALSELYERAKVSEIIEKSDVESIIQNMLENKKKNSLFNNSIKTPKKEIWARTKGQAKLFKEILKKEILFVIGPAGTGKTFIAVSHAVSLLSSGLVDKIIISRPAVEAGEKLGFLPGDLKEKIDPYLRPIYDCLDENLSKEKVIKLIDSQKIEIAPIAYLRGRTLNNSYIILDEAQNTSPIQMKMFLTRLGENSKMVITGDVTQIDLPLNNKSGLVDAVNNLKKVKDISFVNLTDKDVVRHPLVQKIIKAYEK